MWLYFWEKIILASLQIGSLLRLRKFKSVPRYMQVHSDSPLRINILTIKILLNLLNQPHSVTSLNVIYYCCHTVPDKEICHNP